MIYKHNQEFVKWRDEMRNGVDGYTERDAFEAGQQSKQAKIDELQAMVDELKKHSLMLREAANSWTYSEGEKNILISQADDLDRILKGNKD